MGKINRVGFPCLTTSLGFTTGHTTRLNNFSEEKQEEKINENIGGLINILNWMGKTKLRMFRMSSEFVPFATHNISKNIDWESKIKYKLTQIGEYFLPHNFRFSIHAMPFVVLNSPKSYVVKNSLNELEYYTKLLDCLGCDNTHKIIIHPGGVYNDKPQAIKNLKTTLNSIDPKIKSRLILENDDKHYSYRDVLEIGEDVGIPPILDIHHFYLLPSPKIARDLERGKLLWDSIPKIHASSSMPNARHGTHDDYTTQKMLKRITQIIPYDVDVMFECGKKEEAATKAYEYFAENNYLV